MKYKIVDKDDGRLLWVTKEVRDTIREFQKLVKYPKQFEKLLMTANDGSSVVGEVLFDWKTLADNNPWFKDDLYRLGRYNHFNTVLEFTGLNEEGEIARSCVLFGIESWEISN